MIIIVSSSSAPPLGGERERSPGTQEDPIYSKLGPAVTAHRWGNATLRNADRNKTGGLLQWRFTRVVGRYTSWSGYRMPSVLPTVWDNTTCRVSPMDIHTSCLPSRAPTLCRNHPRCCNLLSPLCHLRIARGSTQSRWSLRMGS